MLRNGASMRRATQLGVAAIAALLATAAVGPAHADDFPNPDFLVQIVGETVDGATILAIPPEEDDYAEYASTAEYATYRPPASYLWALDGKLSVNPGTGLINGSAWSRGWYSGPTLNCTRWSGSVYVSHIVKAEGQYVDPIHQEIYPVYSLSPSRSTSGVACLHMYSPADASLSVPLTGPSLQPEYVPSTWTSTHNLRVSATWMSPSGKRVRYKSARITRTCLVQFPADLVEDGIPGKCETHVTAVDDVSPTQGT